MLMPPHRRAGFSLIELMVAIAIVGLLAAVVGPYFFDQIRKGRRSEAYATLTLLQQAQERWRSTNASYSTDLGTLGVPATSPNGYYAIAIAAADANSYTATATAASGTSQAGDRGCQVLAVRMTGGNLGYGSAVSGAADWSDPGRCWAR